MTDVALGVTVFQRTRRLTDLLDSISGDVVNTVYVADNGNTSDRAKLYSNDFPFEFNVLNLEYNAGLGRCREAIVEALVEDYLVLVDSDNTLPRNVGVLIEQLQEKPGYGGIGGVLHEDKRLLSRAHNFYERGNVLFMDTKNHPSREIVAGNPLFKFEKIQNAAVFRRSCLEEYCWDPAFKIGWEHADFFIGHKQLTDWKFGVCPSVLFEHNPGGSETYMSDRRAPERLAKYKKYFLEKWGYRQVARGQVDWIDTNYGYRNKNRTVADLVKNVYLRLPSSIVARLVDIQDSKIYK